MYARHIRKHSLGQTNGERNTPRTDLLLLQLTNYNGFARTFEKSSAYYLPVIASHAPRTATHTHGHTAHSLGKHILLPPTAKTDMLHCFFTVKDTVSFYLLKETIFLFSIRNFQYHEQVNFVRSGSHVVWSQRAGRSARGRKLISDRTIGRNVVCTPFVGQLPKK